MDAILVFIGKLLSCCGLCIEEEELREPLKDENENVVPNKSCWSGSDKIKSQMHSDSLPLQFLSGIHNNYLKETEPDSSATRVTSNAKVLAETDSSKKVTPAIDQKPKEVKLSVAKEKSSCKDHPKNTESRYEYEVVVNNTTLTALLSEFNTALENNESYNHLNFLGSLLLESVSANTIKKSRRVERNIQGYSSSQKILLVGEGDFSFSACLAKVFGSATNMVATSLNSEEYLKTHYSDAMNNISELITRGCKVFHEVDATVVSTHKSIKGLSFDRIVYNFPHCGEFSSTPYALRENQHLVREFMSQSAKLMKKEGEIHIRHKCNYFYRTWNLQMLAWEAGLVLIEETPFDVSKFIGYNTKYGFEGWGFKSDYNFNCHSSSTYKFVLKN